MTINEIIKDLINAFAPVFILPLPSNIKNIIAYFDKQPNTKIFLFGAGEMENELVSDWQSLYENVYAVHTNLQLDDELALMNFLDVMLCMDSANMHIASLVNTPVISVWGAT